MPLFWQGAARHGAHLDMRLISTGPEADKGKRVGEMEREEEVNKKGRHEKTKEKERDKHNILVYIVP